MTRIQSTISLGFIALAGLALRLYHLGLESLWYDEGFSVLAARAGWPGMLSVLQSHMPTYFLMLGGWMKVFGASEFSIRFPSLLFGVAGVLAMYRLTRLFAGRSASLISALFLALSVAHIRHAQDARMYTPEVFWTIVSMFFFVKLLNRGTLKHFAGYFVASAFTIYFHHFGFFIVFAQNIYFFGSLVDKTSPHRALLGKWFSAQVLLGLAAIPIFLSIPKQMSINSYDWLQPPSLLSSLGALRYFVAYTEAGLPAPAASKLLFFHCTLLTAGGLMLSLKSIKRLPLLLLLFFVPIIVPTVISILKHPVYHHRYALASSGAIYIFMAVFLSSIRSVKLRSILLLVTVLLMAFNLNTYYSQQHNPEWRKAVTFVQENSFDDDLIIIHPFVQKRCSYDYYSSDDLRKESAVKDLKDNSEDMLKDMVDLVSGHDRVWMMYHKSYDKKGLIRKGLGDVMRQSGAWDFFKIRIILYERALA